jgi:ribonuclease HII
MKKRIIIAGIDEAGRGPLAGPVTAACVCFAEGYENSKITDSKKLTKKARDSLFDEIVSASMAYSVVSVGSKKIDRINILQATRLAMLLSAKRVEKQLVTQLGDSFDLRLQIDGNQPIATNLPQQTIIKGDATVMVIGAASILAKVTRDRLMEKLHERYPNYDLNIHKGYPTKVHLEKIAQYGPSIIHRRTFRGVKEHIKT